MNRLTYTIVWICATLSVSVVAHLGFMGTGLGVAVGLYLFTVLTLFALLVVDSVAISRQPCYDVAGDIDYSHASIVSVNPDGSYNVSIGYRMELK